MTNIVPAAGPSYPTPCPPGIDRAVAYLTNRLVSAGAVSELPSGDAPTTEQRQGLQRRLGRLAGWLAPFAPSEEQRVRDELYALLSTRKREGDTSVGDARAIVALYVADLRDLPFHAIQAACLDFRQGRVPEDKGFRPPQGDIRRQAQKHLHSLAAEQRRIQAILDAKLVDRRSDAATRAAQAAAARRSFGIREPGSEATGKGHEAPLNDKGHLANVAKEIFLGSSMDAWRRKQAEKSGAAYPDGRFDDEHDEHTA